MSEIRCSLWGNGKQQVTRHFIFCCALTDYLLSAANVIHDCKDGAKSLFTVVYYALNDI